MSMKNPLILAGIEPAIFRFVAQHLNHCATAVPGRRRFIFTVNLNAILCGGAPMSVAYLELNFCAVHRG